VIQARDATSTPLVSVPPDRTVRTATPRPRKKGLKKIVVLNDFDAIGILTATGIVDDSPELKVEIRAQLDREIGHSGHK
jgi:hypothetical protein